MTSDVETESHTRHTTHVTTQKHSEFSHEIQFHLIQIAQQSQVGQKIELK